MTRVLNGPWGAKEAGTDHAAIKPCTIRSVSESPDGSLSSLLRLFALRLVVLVFFKIFLLALFLLLLFRVLFTARSRLLVIVHIFDSHLEWTLALLKVLLRGFEVGQRLDHTLNRFLRRELHQDLLWIAGLRKLRAGARDVCGHEYRVLAKVVRRAQRNHVVLRHLG